MTVVFFISGHGFGHASREVEVLNALSAQVPDIRVILRTALPPPLLARTIRAPYELRPGACDTGIVQRTSVEHDDEATVREAVAFYDRFEERVRDEAAALAGDDVGVVVGDIPPLAFEVAARLGVPSVAIANFTWDWIYETHPGAAEAAPHLVPLMRAAYRRATLALELPFGGGFEIFRHVTSLPLVARRPTHSPEETRDYFGVPRDRPAVLLSFGGYGMPALDVSALDCPEWTVVMTDRIQQAPADRPGHLVYIDESRFLGGGYRYEDLIASVDVVMSKPGYGIVSECITCDTPLLYTSRGIFREYDVFTRDMPRYLRCRFIEQSELFAGRWLTSLEGLLNQKPAPDTIATNGADVAAQLICGVRL